MYLKIILIDSQFHKSLLIDFNKLIRMENVNLSNYYLIKSF
jgi:hypothetical protein